MKIVRFICIAVFSFFVGNVYASRMSIGEASRLIDRGKRYLLGKKTNPDSAVVCFKTVMDAYSTDMPLSQQYLCGTAANNLGFVYLQYIIDCKSAYAAFIKAKEISEKTGNLRTMAIVYTNLGNLYSIFSEHINSGEMEEDAMGMYKLAFNTAYASRQWNVLCSSFCNLTDIGQSFKNYRQYTDVLRKFSRLHVPSGTPLARYSRLRCEALNAYVEKDLARATSLLIRSMEEIDDNVTPDSWKAQSLNLTIALYLERNMPDSAMYYVKSIIDSPQGFWGYDVRANAYNQLRAIYIAKGDSEKARYAYSRMLMLRDSLSNVYRLGAVENMKFMTDLATQKHHSAILLSEANRKRQLGEMLLTFVCMLLVAMAVILVVFIWRNRRLNRRYRSLYRKQQEMLAIEKQERAKREEELSSEKKAKSAVPATSTSYTAPQSAVSQKTRILAVMDETDEKFSSDFSLDRLAELVGITPRALSAVLNDSLGKSFHDLLNQYRVNEACIRLTDTEKYGNLTIEAISQSVGYKSRTSLVTAFKKETGLTPSEYLRIARQGNV